MDTGNQTEHLQFKRKVDEHFTLRSAQELTDKQVEELLTFYRGIIGEFYYNGIKCEITTPKLELTNFRLVVGKNLYIESDAAIDAYYESIGLTKYDPSKADKKKITFLQFKSTIEDVPNDTPDSILVEAGDDGFFEKLEIIVDASTMEEINMYELTNYKGVFSNLDQDGSDEFNELFIPLFRNNRYTFWMLSRILPYGCNAIGHTYKTMLDFVYTPEESDKSEFYTNYLRDKGFEDEYFVFGLNILNNIDKIGVVLSNIQLPSIGDAEENNDDIILKICSNLIGCEMVSLSLEQIDFLFEENHIRDYAVDVLINKGSEFSDTYDLLQTTYILGLEEGMVDEIAALPKGVLGKFDINGKMVEIVNTLCSTGTETNMLVGSGNCTHFVPTTSETLNKHLSETYPAYDVEKREALEITIDGDINVEISEDPEDSVSLYDGGVKFVVDMHLLCGATIENLATYLPYVEDSSPECVSNSLELNPFYGKPEDLEAYLA